jgi:hypothetical protein
MDFMPILGEDQKTALIERLRQGAPSSPHYTAPSMVGAGEAGEKIGEKTNQLYASLKEKGDGSAWEGLKNQIGVGNPNIYADNYQVEFGKYDPSFNVDPSVSGTTMPVGVQTGGMFGGGVPDQFQLSGVNLDGSQYAGVTK